MRIEPSVQRSYLSYAISPESPLPDNHPPVGANENARSILSKLDGTAHELWVDACKVD